MSENMESYPNANLGGQKEPTKRLDDIQRALAGTARVSEIVRRDMFIPEAARGNENSLWETMASKIRVMTRTYKRSAKPIELFEMEVRDAWYLFILAAKNIDAHHPAQDRLTRLILWARELGVLKRTLKSSEVAKPFPNEADAKDVANAETVAQGGDERQDLVVQDALTSQGRIWVDLPFMVGDIQDAWKSAMIPSKTPQYQRCNLAAGIARLAGLGICDESFASCGLDIMRRGLELHETDESRSSSDVQIEPSGAIQAETPLNILQLLSLIQIWLRYSGHKFLQLSIESFMGSESSRKAIAASPGQLARAAGVDMEGFSLLRFDFWKRRLSDLKEVQDKAVKEVATACSNIMTEL